LPPQRARALGVGKRVDFRFADWLPKSDARQHFKGRYLHFKISVRATLFGQIGVIAESVPNRTLVRREIGKE
jgi:putative lipoic acid-binding regulatory protein